MVKKIFIIICFSCSFLINVAQPPAELYKTAKALMREGDYDNATLVFNKLIEQNPTYTEGESDYAYLHYLKRDFAKAIELSKKITEKPDATEQSFQILGLCYKAIAQYKEASLMYKTALKKLPNSGVLYGELADLDMLDKKPVDALRNWEKGIEVDPNYANNYYNAAMYYAQNNKHFWAAIYGETFVNLDSYSLKTAEVKSMLLDAYKKLILLQTDATKTNSFEKVFFQSLGKDVVEINATNLSLIRTKFILNWFYNKNNESYPFRLFDQQRYLIKEGLFEAYNQWIFGVAQNAADYKTWIDKNATAANNFKNFQQGRVFKLITGQYYKD